MNILWVLVICAISRQANSWKPKQKPTTQAVLREDVWPVTPSTLPCEFECEYNLDLVCLRCSDTDSWNMYIGECVATKLCCEKFGPGVKPQKTSNKVCYSPVKSTGAGARTLPGNPQCNKVCSAKMKRVCGRCSPDEKWTSFPNTCVAKSLCCRAHGPDVKAQFTAAEDCDQADSKELFRSVAELAPTPCTTVRCDVGDPVCARCGAEDKWTQYDSLCHAKRKCCSRFDRDVEMQLKNSSSCAKSTENKRGRSKTNTLQCKQKCSKTRKAVCARCSPQGKWKTYRNKCHAERDCCKSSGKGVKPEVKLQAPCNAANRWTSLRHRSDSQESSPLDSDSYENNFFRAPALDTSVETAKRLASKPTHRDAPICMKTCPGDNLPVCARCPPSKKWLTFSSRCVAEIFCCSDQGPDSQVEVTEEPLCEERLYPQRRSVSFRDAPQEQSDAKCVAQCPLGGQRVCARCAQANTSHYYSSKCVAEGACCYKFGVGSKTEVLQEKECEVQSRMLPSDMDITATRGTPTGKKLEWFARDALRNSAPKIPSKSGRVAESRSATDATSQTEAKGKTQS